MRLSRFFLRAFSTIGLILGLAIGVSTVYAAPSVTVTEGGGSTNVTEGGATDTYTVVLGEAPSADVTVTLTHDGQISLNTTTLTFTTVNWATAQTITVTAVNDAVDEASPHTSIITHAATGGGYNGVTIADVTANITDNDTAGVTIVQSGGTTAINETGPTNDSYTLVLTSQPTADVTITVIHDAQVSLNATTFTFTAVNWATAQTVTVTAVNDDVDEASPHTSVITHAATGGGYTGVTIADVTASITDNDTAGVTIVQSGGTTAINETGPTNDTYTLILTSQPTADVTITLTHDAQVSLNATTFTFTAGNWATTQTVTVTAVNDDVDEASPHTSVITHAATGGGYTGVTIADVTVSITDNDTAGVTIVESGGTTAISEGGSNDSYTVVLDTQPTTDVTITLSTSTQFTLSDSTLTFTAANWNMAQTITVSDVDDAIDEADPHTVNITHTATGGGYTGVTIASVTVSITDDDTAGVTILESGGTTDVTEGGATDTYTVVLTSQPTASVTITLTPDAQVSGAPTPLTFTTANWMTAQTVTVTAVNDAAVEGTHTGTISHTATGGGYTGVTIVSVVADITDNDVPGVTIVQSGGTTNVTEGGATDSYTIVLTSQPSANVIITITPDAQVSVSPTTLTFTTVNWATTQTVTVTAVNDSVDETSPHTATITHSAAGGGYTGVTIADVVTNVTDNDTRGVTINEVGGSTTVSEAGLTDTYTLVLTSQPTADVTITIGVDAQITTAPTSLTFTTVNWNVAQTVTVSAVNDAIDEAASHSGVITHTATGGDYAGISISNVTVSVSDNDTAGMTLVQSGGTTVVTEAGGTDTYTIALNSQPTADVTLTISPDAQTTTSPTSLTFTAVNWNVAQTVTVSAVDDFIDEAASHTSSIGHTATGGGYTGVSLASITASVTDNDTNGVTISETTADVTEGGATDTYTVVLTAQPSASVTITITTGSQVSASPTPLTFTTVNWMTPQTVTITAVDDAIDEAATHSGGSVTHTPTGGGYTGVSVASVAVTVTDNDTAGVTIVQSGGSTDVTEGGATDTYTVVLDTQPTASVTITLTGTEVTTSPTSLTFTTSNWMTAQTVTVTAVNDSDAEGDHLGSVSHSALNGGYTGISIATVSVNISDNDTKGVTIVQSGGTTTVTEGGATDSYTVVLDSRPSGSVTITLTGTQVSLSPASLTFTNSNWSTAQTVTVTALDDFIDEASPHAGLVAHTPSGGGYSAVAITDVTVAITDNDIAGVTLVQSGGTTTVTEGGATDSYTAVLTSQPTADVTVTLTNSQVTTSAPTLTFTTVNWNVAQTVTVTAVNDAIVEGTHSGSVGHTAAGGGYDAVSIATVSVTITDNDTGSLVITPLTADVTEGSTTDTYTVTLGAQPSGDVTVTLAPDTEVTTSPTSLTFTTGNWNVAQTVTVSAVNDAIVEGAHTGLVTHSASGGAYVGVTGADVTVNVTDNDTGGGVIAQSGGTTQVAEQGETSDTYTFALSAQPKGAVTVTVTAGTHTSVNPTTLTFTNANWSTPQTITVTAVNDFIDQGDTFIDTVTHDASGGGYSSVTLPDLAVTVEDNDIAGLAVISLLPLGNGVTEGGNTDGFNIRLNSEPIANVTISVAATADYTASPMSLTYTPANWRDYQEVILTAVDDALLEGTEIIPLTIPSSGSPGYNGTFVGIDITVVDNDTTITPDVGGGLAVAEGSLSSDSYTLVQNDNPPATVTTTVSSSQCTVSADNITFDDEALITLNGTTPVTVYIRAVDDSVAEGAHTCTIEHAPTVSSDPSYNGMLIPDATANITDNDSAGFTLNETGGSTSINEGDTTDSFNLVLTSQPTATVTVTINHDDDATTSPTSLTFTTGNWNIAQTVILTAVDDRIVEGTHNSLISLDFASSDANYNPLSDEVTATVTDNDSAAITFTDATAANLENVGSVVRTVVITYTTIGSGNFGLESALTVGLSTTEGTATDDDYVLDVTSVTFGVNVADNITRNYSYTLVNDNVAEVDEVFNIVLGSPTSDSAAMLTRITVNDTLPVTILNDDTAGITIEESGGSSTVTEGGAGDDYTVALGTEPTGTVTIALTFSQVTTSPTTLTFTTGNWDTPQTVTITAVDDLVSEGAHDGTITHTASGGGYSGSTTIDVSINDNDSQSVIVFPATVNVTEDGGTDSFTVKLSSQPTGAVTITMSSDQATADPDVLTFNTVNWDTEKTVTVSAIDDGLVEAIEHLGFIELTPTGGGYDAVVIEDVDVNIIDNDSEGVIVSETEVEAVEGGTDGTYTLRLRTQPPEDVIVSLTGDPQLDLSTDEVTFNASNWNTPQTITLTAIDDGLFEGAQSATILHSVTSEDAAYDGIAVSSVAVSIIDGESDLLVNGGFETVGLTPESADSWTGKNLVATKDMRACNTIEEPNIAFAGTCAFQFSAAAAGSSAARKATQTFTTPVWGVKNDQLMLSAQIESFKVKSGGKLTLQIVYTDNTKKNVSITIPTGTHSYTLFTRTVTLTKRAKKVTVVLNMAKAGGRARLDEVALTLTPKAFRNAMAAQNSVLPLPPPP